MKTTSPPKLFRRDFTLVAIGQIISLFGNAILRFALPLYLLRQTGSAALFGLVSACSFLPMIALFFLGGVLADRVNKRNIMVALDFFTALLVLSVYLGLGRLPLVLLILVPLMLLYGISGTYQPAVQASIPALVEGERDKLLRLPEELHRRVVGQDEAVEKVSEAILRSRAGIQDPDRPIGSFLFLGPTGVGKTELAKALAQALFDDEHSMVRIDMTEYMEKFAVSRLIGAPPGYVGYEEGGQLTEQVRRHPYSVILFDEVEKAHPDVFNILLQVLDDGRITDSQGRTVDFKNTIIILTSNLGSGAILEGIGPDGQISEGAKEEVNGLLRRQFRPEFLNRLDEIVFYKPLTREEISGIVELQIADLRRRLADKQLSVELTAAAKEYVVAQGYDPVYGARPLKRFIQSKVETLIARLIIRAELAPRTTIVVDYDGHQLTAEPKGELQAL